MFRKPFTLEAVLASPVVCAPLTLYMLCSPNEGAAAVVLRRADGDAAGSRAGARGGAALAPAGQRARRAHADVRADRTRRCRRRRELAARAAYEEAGIGPDDLDVVELQDTDSARELISCEELGLCAKGGAGELIDQRRTDRDGPLPVNPSGGLLSKGEPLGASALGQVVELTWQLRGQAGPRQVAERQSRAWATPSAAAPMRPSSF